MSIEGAIKDREKFEREKDWRQNEGKLIIVDLDGTLCHCAWRSPLAKDGEWDKFHKAAENDLPNNTVIQLLHREAAFARDAEEPIWIVCLTGRPINFFKQTMAYFEKYNIPIDELVMRPEGDFTSDYLYKVRELRRRFDFSRIRYVLEDRDTVVKAFRECGLTVFQVNSGSY